MSKPNNIIEALRERQYRYRQGVIAPILKRTAENIMMRKSYLKDSSSYKFNLIRNVRTTFLTVFSPDGKRVACAHGDRTISIISMDTLKVERVLSGGHHRSPWTISWAAHSEGSNYIIASGCLGGHVRLWFSDDHQEMSYDFSKAIASLSFHPTKPILSIAVDNTLVFWNFADSTSPQFIIPFEEKETRIRYVSFDHTGKNLVTGINQKHPIEIEYYNMSTTYTIEVWQMPDSGLMTHFDHSCKRFITDSSTLHNDSTVAIDKGFTMLATTVSVFNAEFVNVYNLKSNRFAELLHSIQSASVVSISFSPTLRYLIIGHNNLTDCCIMSVFEIDGKEWSHASEVTLHKLPIQEMNHIKSLTGVLNEFIQHFMEKRADLICVCRNLRDDIRNEKVHCEMTCDWFLNYIRTIDRFLSHYDNLIVHNAEFKVLIRNMKRKYELCQLLTADVLNEMVNFGFEVQKFLRYNVRNLGDQHTIVKLNCLSWSPNVDTGILASFNNGKIVLIK